MCITNVADILTPLGLKDLMKRVMGTYTISKTWTRNEKPQILMAMADRYLPSKIKENKKGLGFRLLLPLES